MMGEQLPSLSARARGLLAEERSRTTEDEALKRRVIDRAREVLWPDRPSGVALRAGTLAGPATRRAPGASPFAAAALMIAGLAAAGGGFYRFSAPAPSESPEPAVQGAAAIARTESEPALVAETTLSGTTAAVAPAAAAETLAQASRERPVGHLATASDSTPSTSVEQYAIELGVLEPARRAIGQSNYVAALAAIARHQREFPQSQLSEEREALRVRALWGMGQKAAAGRAAAAFRNQYPKSGLLSWLP